jgi:hypothetical protein
MGGTYSTREMINSYRSSVGIPGRMWLQTGASGSLVNAVLGIWFL